MTISLVTGGTQGVGKGIVEGLAEAGHSIYFTGRDKERLVQTETEANKLGGTVEAKQVDHLQDEEVVELFRHIDELGELDVLVNNAWGGYENMVEDGKFTFIDPYWEQPLWRWDAMMTTGVRSAFVASQLATRKMLNQSRGLIINISFWAAQKFTGNILYGMSKAATDKMTADMAAQLKDKNIKVISLYPGLVRTEKVMENSDFLDLSNSESPRFSGRVIAALCENEKFADELNGKVTTVADVANQLGIIDIDGKSPRALTLEDI